MAGVSSPMFRRGGAGRFLGGFTVGTAVAGALLTVLLIPANLVLVNVSSVGPRTVVFAVLAVALASLDLAGRTPYTQRQVPQRFGLDGVTPARLGIIYGADAGLHITTQKTTSLIWAAIAGCVLLGSPVALAAALLTTAISYGLSVTGVAILSERTSLDLNGWGWNLRKWIRTSQVLAGIALLLVSATLVTRLVLS